MSKRVDAMDLLRAVAILMVLTGMNASEAHSQLQNTNGFLRKAVLSSKQAAKQGE